MIIILQSSSHPARHQEKKKKIHVSTRLRSVIDIDQQNQPFSHNFELQIVSLSSNLDPMIYCCCGSNDDELVSLKNHLLIKHTRWILILSWMKGLRKWNGFYGNVVFRIDLRCRFSVWIPNEMRVSVEVTSTELLVISGWFQLEICRTSSFFFLRRVLFMSNRRDDVYFYFGLKTLSRRREIICS